MSEADRADLTEELIYQHIKDAPQQQMEKANWLDDKILRTFGAASVVMGFVGLSTNSAVGPHTFFLLLPLIPYALVAFWTFQHIDPERFHWGLQADKLPTRYQESERNVRRALITEIGKSYKKNKPLLKKKACRLRAALIATGVEVGLIVVALILLRLT